MTRGPRGWRALPPSFMIGVALLALDSAAVGFIDVYRAQLPVPARAELIELGLGVLGGGLCGFGMWALGRRATGTPRLGLWISAAGWGIAALLALGFRGSLALRPHPAHALAHDWPALLAAALAVAGATFMASVGTSIGLAIAAWRAGPRRALIGAVISIALLYGPGHASVTLQGPFGDELHRAVLVSDLWILGAALARLVVLFALAAIAAGRVVAAPPSR